MITSHVLHNPCQHCLLLALPAASLRPRIATFLSPANDLKRLGYESTTACIESPAVGVSGFHSGSRLQNNGVYARQGNRVSSPGNFFSVTVRASMEVAATADVKDSKSEDEVQKVDPIIQYIVLRKDLVDKMKWPLGSVISQGCHAAVAAVWLFKDDPVTAEYCSSENLDNMNKVTLEVKGETQLSNLAKKLEAGGVAHKLWTEQPENYPTCLATKPYHKSEQTSRISVECEAFVVLFGINSSTFEVDHCCWSLFSRTRACEGSTWTSLLERSIAAKNLCIYISLVGKLELCTTERFLGMDIVVVFTSYRQQDLANAHTGANSQRLPERPSHSRLQTIGSSARQHLVDSQDMVGVHPDS